MSGYSVREVIKETESLLNVKVAHSLAPPREGDPAKLVASNKLIASEWNWKPEKSLSDMILST
jgi:UDP-glucose 4-epimerase